MLRVSILTYVAELVFCLCITLLHDTHIGMCVVRDNGSNLKLMELTDVFLLQVKILLNKWSSWSFQRRFVPFPT